jgi:hypothetical protein
MDDFTIPLARAEFPFSPRSNDRYAHLGLSKHIRMRGWHVVITSDQHGVFVVTGNRA